MESVCQQKYSWSPQGVYPHLASLHRLVWEQRMQLSVTILAAAEKRGKFPHLSSCFQGMHFPVTHGCVGPY